MAGRASRTLIGPLLVALVHLLMVEGQGSSEGFFGGSDAYAVIRKTLDLRRSISFAFRTCSHGHLVYQKGSGGDYLLVELLFGGQVEVRWKVGDEENATLVGSRLNDNRWHSVHFRQRLGELLLEIDDKVTTIASPMSNAQLLNINLANETPKLLIGRDFLGCIQQGPGILLNDPSIESVNVNWSPCPAQKDCGVPSVDYCFSEPCQHGGACRSTVEGYTCQCTKRYGGIHCEKDKGPLCEEPGVRCYNGGVCVEEGKGNGTLCVCPPKYTGSHCETKIDRAVCLVNPCKNNGTCVVNHFGDAYECHCNKGFAGSRCEIDIDECLSSPCENGGRCVDGVDSYVCDCRGTGYRGNHCQENINECEESNPCLNGSTCYDRHGSYLCDCLPGMSGSRCDQDTDECLSAPCLNGATCLNFLDRYECHCVAGFEGFNCETNINDCANVTCPSFSTCVDGIATHACLCLPGYTGSPATNCTEVDECASGPCHHGSTCVDLVNSFRCDCPPGFSGSRCDLNIDDCQSLPCFNDAKCIDIVNGYMCECSLGFTGQRCETNIDDCALNPCKNGGVCKDMVNGYNCSCASGWTGFQCETNINECESTPCANNATCHDLLDKFSCSCIPGFTGALCEINIDDCVSSPCMNGGTCHDLTEDYKCDCTQDFMGKTCSEAYDACAWDICKNGGSCHSTPPSHSYQCKCITGFEGENCENNIDDCIGILCNNSQVCIDKVNGYECRCPDGFTGEDCTVNINECASNPCFNNSQCIDGISNFTCICAEGFTGHLCDSDIDECAENPCKHGICHNYPGGYQCYCQPGFSGNNCNIDFDECLSHPCQNNGSCKNLVNGYHCNCAPGYTGHDCDIDINECESQPCQNNGTCEDLINAYACHCIPGFTGSNCETDIDECASDPCQNSGHCIDKINGFDCNCTDTGFKGDFCEVNIDDCDPFPCINDANCTDLIKNYQCDCHIGYIGKTCEIDINECADRPCENEGLCLERSNLSFYTNNYLGLFPGPFSYSNAGGYLCHCVPGFRGENCSENIDDCDPDPCFNGTCIDGINNYTCDCFPGFEGSNCETEIDECERYAPCQGGSTCFNTIGDYQCVCLPLYGGKNCSVPLLGCVENKCENNSTCVPYLIGEDKHVYNCTCSPGYHGRLCEHVTTFSLNNDSSAVIESDLTENKYNLSFSFRTTLPYGLLAASENQSTSFLLQLIDGEISLQVMTSTFQESLKIEKKANTASWIHVNILFSKFSIELKVEIEEKEYLKTVNLSEPYDWAFYKTYFGQSPGLAIGSEHNNFIGCMQDVKVNDKWMIPELYKREFIKIEIGCNRIDQCNLDPCSQHGTCVDLWTNFYCDCNRPFLGRHCNYSYTAATFGHEKETSLAVINVSPNDTENFRDHLNISLFLRTRKDEGLIFYMGNRGTKEDLESLALELKHGQPEITFRTQGTPLKIANSLSPRLDDGNYHLLEASILRSTEHHQLGIIRLAINDSVILYKDVAISNQNYHHIFLGSLPHLGQRKRQASFSDHVIDLSHYSTPPSYNEHFSLANGANPNLSEGKIEDQYIHLKQEASQFSDQFTRPSLAASGSVIKSVFDDGMEDSLSPVTVPTPNFSADFPHNKVYASSSNEVTTVHFKGILQDLRVNGKTVPFFQMNIPEIIPIPSYPEAVLYNVREGVISDDTCKINPCINNSTCQITWNDYRCLCTPAFRGKNCSQIEFCYWHSCPPNSQCRSLDDGFECISNGTFNGISSVAQYRADVFPNTTLNTITFQYRTQKAGLLFFLHNASVGFIIKIHISGSYLVIEQESYAEQDSYVNLTINANATDGEWHSVSVSFEDTAIIAKYDGKMSFVNTSYLVAISEIIRNSEIFIGGPPASFEHNYFYYRGCLQELRIGGILLPFFTEEQIVNNTSKQQFIVEKLSEINSSACVLCYEYECYNSGLCTEPLESYFCNCSAGFEGHHCESDINECDFVNCHEGQCQNLPGNYSCICPRGFTGKHCEDDIDECAFPDTCKNGGTCINSIGNYDCHCNANYTGSNCERLLSITCDHEPCQHGATCHSLQKREVLLEENYYRYQCECTGGYLGRDCDTARDFCAPIPCVHGICVNEPHKETFSCDCDKGFTGLVCDINIDECEPNPCKNNATCNDEIANYTCKCKPGFHGTNCSEDINECNENPCKNGGTCANDFGSYHCDCYGNFTGKNCSIDNPCILESSNNCTNGGECTVDEDNIIGNYYFCQCLNGYEGIYCEKKLDSFDLENLAIVIGPVVGITLLIAFIAVIIFFMMARKKRATRGTYSPSRQEMFGSRVEMGNVMKPPPEERLI